MTLQNDLFKPNFERSEIRQYDHKSQGTEANDKGQELEKQVRTMFERRGAIIVSYHKYIKQSNDLFDRRMLVPQFRHTAVMRHEAKADFVYFHEPHTSGIGIECKVQDGSGSVDEKLFYMYHNAMKWKFADRAWFVISGGGFRKDVVTWLERHASAEYPGKPIRVFRSIDSLRVAVKELVERGNPMGGA